MIERFFLEREALPSLLPDYHPRPTQIEAAELISDAISNHTDIILEAPTGSGKTIAYLVPIFERGCRAIISTKTKQLMYQLYLKDIPVMKQLFGDQTVAMLKGRKNYFCPYRFRRWIYPNSIFYHDVIEWYESNLEEIIELPRGLFDYSTLDKMSADSRQCLHNKCEYYESCPFKIAKERANAANLVITNHHLLLSDVARKASDAHGEILTFADHIIFDEAHSLADIYALYAGVEFSAHRLVQLFNDHKTIVPFEDLHKLAQHMDTLFKAVKNGKSYYSDVNGEVTALVEHAHNIADKVSDSDLKMEFAHYLDAFCTISSDTTEGLKMAEQRGRDVLVKYIPDSVGNSFSEGIKEASVSSVFISATLTTGGNFDYFLREMGMQDKKMTTAILPHVFKMKDQARLFVPEMNGGDTSEKILELVNNIPGSVLLICNSLSRMEFLVEYISEKQDKKVVFSQNDGDWSTFTTTDNMVLVGCATLREGLDLAGGDFNCVIIDKLPFEYPHDLYISHKAKEVEEKVGNSFINFNLPRAVLYFKQACGRLIRHESDRGIWAVFDDRILTKRYGKYFLDVLDNVVVVKSLGEALAFLESR